MNLNVFVSASTLKDMEKEIPKMRLVTISTLINRFKIVGSLARRIIRHFAAKGDLLPLDS